MQLGEASSATPTRITENFDFEIASRTGVKRRVGHVLQRCVLRLSQPITTFVGKRFDSAFGILLYHRVIPAISGFAEPTINVTPTRLRAQLKGLLARGFEPWPLSKMIQQHQAGEPIPRNAFVVTFDDGYACNYSHAWPVLRELSVPATIFVATAYLDSQQPFPFDHWRDAGVPATRHAWQPLSVKQCHELLSSGFIEIGAHTHTHADFRGRPVAFQSDLEQCLEVLRTTFDIHEISFAFPQGRKAPGFAGPELVEAARRTDVTCALTTENDLVLGRNNPLGEWGRFTVEECDSAGTIAARLDGWYSLVRDSYRGLPRRG